MSFDTVTPVLAIKAGKLRALAVTTGKRSSALPDLPDAGGIRTQRASATLHLVRSAYPRQRRRRLWRGCRAESMKIIQSPDFAKRMVDIGAEPIGNTSEQMKDRSATTPRSSHTWCEAKVTIRVTDRQILPAPVAAIPTKRVELGPARIGGAPRSRLNGPRKRGGAMLLGESCIAVSTGRARAVRRGSGTNGCRDSSVADFVAQDDV